MYTDPGRKGRLTISQRNPGDGHEEDDLRDGGWSQGASLSPTNSDETWRHRGLD